MFDLSYTYIAPLMIFNRSLQFQLEEAEEEEVVVRLILLDVQGRR
jgi:hypothetical protein